MQTTKRKLESGLMELLLEQPQRCTFTQLINVLLRTLRRQGIGYRQAFRDVLSFRNSLSLAFPASQVEALDAAPDLQETLAALRRGQPGSIRGRIHITPAFIGLLGTSGTLPLHDTERLAARRAHNKDSSQIELLDLLSNRLVGQFYQAWGKYRVEHSLDVRDQDLLLPMLTSLAGIRPRSSPDSNAAACALRQQVADYFAGLLRTRPVSASTIEQVLTARLAVPVKLEQLVGCWNAIPENRRCTLGVKAPVLGISTTLGVRQWRHDLHARLDIGPLDQAQLQRFLPGGSALDALRETVKLFAVPSIRYEVRLLLAPSCIEQFTLDTRAAPRRLGWSTFLTRTPGSALRPEIRAMLTLQLNRVAGSVVNQN